MPNRIQNDLLASTAYWIAAVRAMESARDDHLFYDPWAETLAGPTGAVWMKLRTPESLVPIIIRTRYFDDFIQEKVNHEGIDQIVFLGAGLDTRAFRLTWPDDIVIYEIDQPSVIQYKDSVLQEQRNSLNCIRRTIQTDLSQDWITRLNEKGYKADRASIWILEGFLFYLTDGSIHQILSELSSITATGSWLGFDCINSHLLSSPLTSKWVAMQAESGAPWIGTLDDPVKFLSERGWKAYLTQAGAPDAHYGRWTLPVVPTDLPNFPHNWYVTAQKG